MFLFLSAASATKATASAAASSASRRRRVVRSSSCRAFAVAAAPHAYGRAAPRFPRRLPGGAFVPRRDLASARAAAALPALVARSAAAEARARISALCALAAARVPGAGAGAAGLGGRAGKRPWARRAGAAAGEVVARVVPRSARRSRMAFTCDAARAPSVASSRRRRDPAGADASVGAPVRDAGGIARGARRRDARVREVDARGRRARSTRAAARAERGAGGVWRGEEKGATNRRGCSLRIEVDGIDPGHSGLGCQPLKVLPPA